MGEKASVCDRKGGKKEGEGEEESFVFIVCLLSEPLENEPRGSGHQQSPQWLHTNKNESVRWQVATG